LAGRPKPWKKKKKHDNRWHREGVSYFSFSSAPANFKAWFAKKKTLISFANITVIRRLFFKILSPLHGSKSLSPAQLLSGGKIYMGANSLERGPLFWD
jgi:hypothetical protein